MFPSENKHRNVLRNIHNSNSSDGSHTDGEVATEVKLLEGRMKTFLMNVTAKSSNVVVRGGGGGCYGLIIFLINTNVFSDETKPVYGNYGIRICLITISRIRLVY